MSLYDELMESVIYEDSIEEYNTRKSLQESNKVILGFRIHPHQNLDETFKKHQYLGYLNFIKTKADKNDIEYLRKDLNIGLKDMQKIRNRIAAIEKYGDNEETHNYYKGIKSKYIDKGISVKDVDATIKWYQDNIPQALSDRKKELSK